MFGETVIGKLGEYWHLGKLSENAGLQWDIVNFASIPDAVAFCQQHRMNPRYLLNNCSVYKIYVDKMLPLARGEKPQNRVEFRAMQQAGLIKRVGSRHKARWMVTERGAEIIKIFHPEK